MKKFMYSLAAISAAFMAFSCAKSIEEAPVAEESVLPARTFTCVFAQPDPDSKVALDITNGKTTWEVGDEILINAGSGGTSRRTVTLTADDISADGKTATITIPGDLDPYIHYSKGVQDVTSTYYAMYPASAVASGNLYYNQAFSNQNAFLLAACNVGDTFVFFNLNGLISYKVSGDFDSVSFSGKNGETVAYEVYQARVRDTGSGATITHAKDADTYKPLVPLTTSSTAVVSDGSTINYIYLPGGTAFSGGFTMKFIKSGEIQNVVSSSSAFSVEPGQLVNLGDISSHLLPYVAPSTSDHESEITGATDLGATETANCYIIDTPGAYKIPVVKGNSSESAGNVFDVELVWETYNNAEDVTLNSVIAAVDFDGPTNYIFFKTPDVLKPGNALIAAKDSNDKIIWSWHIWIPASAIATNTYSIYNHALMDRYLGALVAATTSSVPVESFGLQYEWGRKDPFLGARSITSSDFAKRSGTSLSVGYEMTVAQTIANPATYAVYTSTDSWGNWLSPANDATLWKDTEKTIYDPCPAGYRVPKRDQDQPLHSSDLSAVTGWSDNAAAGDNAAYFTLGDPVTVFPYGGLVCENGKYMDHNGDRSFIWTSSVNSSVNPRIMDVRLNTSTHTVTTTVSSRGCSIRCVVDE